MAVNCTWFDLIRHLTSSYTTFKVDIVYKDDDKDDVSTYIRSAIDISEKAEDVYSTGASSF